MDPHQGDRLSSLYLLFHLPEEITTTSSTTTKAGGEGHRRKEAYKLLREPGGNKGPKEHIYGTILSKFTPFAEGSVRRIWMDSFLPPHA